MISSKYWGSISGTQVNQCIRPCTCCLLQIFMLLDSMRRLKKISVSIGQHIFVTCVKPLAFIGASLPAVPAVCVQLQVAGVCLIAKSAVWNSFTPSGKQEGDSCCKPSGKQV